jgi:uncharacterized protein YjbI with pentapeptide repeats
LPEWLDPSKPGLATLITIGIGIPVAYMVWLFRDQNNLWQIENSRKDINLKDFQRLSELACGTHYPEQKECDESYPLRKKAAQSQQVAAIYQLQAFIEGAYGSQFIRPTFLLLKSVWGGLVEKDQLGWDAWLQELSSSRLDGWDKAKYEIWEQKGEHARNEYHRLFAQPLGLALQEVLAGDQGHRIRQNSGDIPSSLISGINCTLPGLKPLQLSNQVLNAVRMRGANLTRSELQGADLSNSQLQGADLSGTKLHGANLEFASVEGAVMNGINLQGASMFLANLNMSSLLSANLQGINLNMSSLIGAVLRDANLQAAKLTNVNFEGTDLSGANLQGANMRNCVWDEHTNFDGCKINSKTKFGRLAQGKFSHDAIDSDWMDEYAIRKEWLDRGAVVVISI